MKISVIFTCYNRKEKTLRCVNSLIEGNPRISFDFLIVDDKSTDGTVEALKSIDSSIKILEGMGNLYWSGGMRIGIESYIKRTLKSDFVLLVNDDVEFFKGSIEKLVNQCNYHENCVVVGATCDNKGKFTYGALKLVENRKTDLYVNVIPSNDFILCDTFNANCVLIRNDILMDVGNFDKMYRHSLADLDYGFMISRKGYNIISSNEFVGICYKNGIENTWRDKSLSRVERLKKKEDIKGSPFKQWFYFLKKNYNLRLAIRYSISPYIRILIKH